MHNITLLARDIQYLKLYAVLRGSHSMSPKELTQRIQIMKQISFSCGNWESSTTKPSKTEAVKQLHFARKFRHCSATLHQWTAPWHCSQFHSTNPMDPYALCPQAARPHALSPATLELSTSSPSPTTQSSRPSA